MVTRRELSGITQEWTTVRITQEISFEANTSECPAAYLGCTGTVNLCIEEDDCLDITASVPEGDSFYVVLPAHPVSAAARGLFIGVHIQCPLTKGRVQQGIATANISHPVPRAYTLDAETVEEREPDPTLVLADPGLDDLDTAAGSRRRPPFRLCLDLCRFTVVSGADGAQCLVVLLLYALHSVQVFPPVSRPVMGPAFHEVVVRHSTSTPKNPPPPVEIESSRVDTATNQRLTNPTRANSCSSGVLVHVSVSVDLEQKEQSARTTHTDDAFALVCSAVHWNLPARRPPSSSPSPSPTGGATQPDDEHFLIPNVLAAIAFEINGALEHIRVSLRSLQTLTGQEDMQKARHLHGRIKTHLDNMNTRLFKHAAGDARPFNWKSLYERWGRMHIGQPGGERGTAAQYTEELLAMYGYLSSLADCIYKYCPETTAQYVQRVHQHMVQSMVSRTPRAFTGRQREAPGVEFPWTMIGQDEPNSSEMRMQVAPLATAYVVRSVKMAAHQKNVRPRVV